LLPREKIIYFGDSARVPYGTRSAATIKNYVRQDINFLKSFNVKLILAACGTASSVALPDFCGSFGGIPIIGVIEPSAAEAALATTNKKIGVIGTSGTIKSGIYRKIFAEIAPDIQVFEKVCPLFVALVENGVTGGTIAELIAREYLEEFKNFGVNTLILACTHFPLLSEVIEKTIGKNVTLINSGLSGAKLAQNILAEKNMSASETARGEIKFFVSDSPESFSALGKIFMGREIKETIEKIDIEKY
jgi:glutamate racemase